MEELGSPNLGCVCTDFHFPCFVTSIHLLVVATIVPGTIFLPAGMLITGWTAQNRVFWLVPDVVSDMNYTLCDGSKRLLQGIALVGAGTIIAFQSIQTYVIDSFTLHAASGLVSSLTLVGFLAHTLVILALAAVSFLRSLAGFGFPLFAPTMYNALGYGKGDTILAVVAIVVGCPACVTRFIYYTHA
jgi:hypothetical protein